MTITKKQTKNDSTKSDAHIIVNKLSGEDKQVLINKNNQMDLTGNSISLLQT